MGWSRTHLSKRQGPINVLRIKDAELDKAYPVCCWDHDNGEELKERVIRHNRPPTVDFSPIATSNGMQQIILPDLAKPWPPRLARRPDLFSPQNDGDDPGDDDDDGDHEEYEQSQNPDPPALGQNN